MDTRRRAHVLVLLVASLVVAIAAFARADGTSETVPTFSVKITPNWIHPTYGGVNHNAVWVYGTSPTTPYRSPDSLHTQRRYLLLDPRATDSDGRRGNDEWWFVIERLWPAGYPADDHGRWGREVNFHNVAGDSGPDGGIGWSFGSGVSALALDWLNGAPSPEFSVFPNAPNHHFILPAVARDKWHTYVVHFIAGRTDGTTVRPGSLQVWADGGSSPVINAQNINTVQRAQGPDGNWYVQKWMSLWEGDYTMDLPETSQVQFALTRIGKTLEEAIDDRPSVAGDNAGAQYYRGEGVNLGPPDADNTGGRSASAAAIPSGLISTPAPPAAPTNTALPTISGTAQAGQTLTTSNGTWDGDPTGYAYQWQRCNTSGTACASIAGATSSTYALTTTDVGATLRAQVKATNDGGTTSASSQPTATVTDAPKPAAPVNTALPTISGTAQAGQTLTASNGTWDGDPTGYAYQWQRCNTSGTACASISGATSSTYALTTTDVGATLRAQVKATNDGGTTSASSQPTATVTDAPKPAAPVNSKRPTIKGKPDLGRTLTASTGSWDGDPTGYAYQWQRCNAAGNACAAVDSATGESYAVRRDDIGATLRVQVKATNAGGTTTATSDHTDSIGKPGGDRPEHPTTNPEAKTDPAPSQPDESEPKDDVKAPETSKPTPPKSQPPTSVAEPPRNKPANPTPRTKAPKAKGDTDSVVRWSGETFETKSELREDLVSRGVDWQDFLRRHPSVVEAYELPYVKWNGRRVFDDRDLASYLGTLGVPWFVWAANHPTAAIMLAAQAHG